MNPPDVDAISKRPRTSSPSLLPPKKQYSQDLSLINKDDGRENENQDDDFLQVERQRKKALWIQLRDCKRRLHDVERNFTAIQDTNPMELDNIALVSLVRGLREKCVFLESFKEKYYSTCKKLDRLSISLQKPNHGQEKPDQPVKESAWAPAPEPDTKELEQELAHVRDICQRRLADLEDAQAESLRLASEIDRLKTQYSGYPVDGYIPGLDLQHQIRLLLTEKEDLKSQVERLVIEAETAHSGLKTEIETRFEIVSQLEESFERDLAELNKIVQRESFEKERLSLSSKAMAIKATETEELNSQLTNTVSMLRGRTESLSSECVRLGKRIKELEALIGRDELSKEHLEKIACDESVFVEELEAIGRAYEEALKINESLVKKLSAKEELVVKLLGEKSRSIAVEKDGQKRSLEDPKNLPAEALSKHREKEMGLSLRVAELEKEISAKQNSVDFYKRKASESWRVQAEIQAKLDLCNSNFQALQSELSNQRKSVLECNNEKTRLEHECAKAKKRLDRIFSATGGSEGHLLLEELKYYQDRLKCPVCMQRERDYALSKCMHVLCKPCIDARLETRQRKCPICTEPFGSSDVRQVFL